MKTRKLIVLLLIALCISVQGYSQLSGSKHDFSISSAWAAGAENTKCGVCHTAHNANSAVTAAPLWNHTLSVATYTMYTSPTMNAIAPTTPGASSKLCLSCHDGTVALGSFGTQTGTTYAPAASVVGGAGTLAHDHPVSILYNTALASADGGLNDPSTAVALGGTIKTKMLFSDYLECASCHDVHRKITTAHLLRIDNAGSLLCLTCHSK